MLVKQGVREAAEALQVVFVCFCCCIDCLIGSGIAQEFYMALFTDSSSAQVLTLSKPKEEQIETLSSFRVVLTQKIIYS